MSQRILLDTTYILPIFGIPIKIKNFEEKMSYIFTNYRILINSLSILEAKWKAIKLEKQHPDIRNYFYEGLIALNNWTNTKIISFYRPEIDHLATNFYSLHNDYFDCSILATAIYFADFFLTEDSILLDLVNQISISDVPNIKDHRLLQGLSKELKVLKVDDFMRKSADT